MIPRSRSSSITSRENHSHGSPTRRKSVRYLSAEGAFHGTSRSGESGLSLIELLMATVLTVIGLVAILNACLRLHALQRLDGEIACAARA